MERITNKKQEQWKEIEGMVKPFHLDNGDLTKDITTPTG